MTGVPVVSAAGSQLTDSVIGCPSPKKVVRPGESGGFCTWDAP